MVMYSTNSVTMMQVLWTVKYSANSVKIMRVLWAVSNSCFVVVHSTISVTIMSPLACGVHLLHGDIQCKFCHNNASPLGCA